MGSDSIDEIRSNRLNHTYLNSRKEINILPFMAIQ